MRNIWNIQLIFSVLAVFTLIRRCLRDATGRGGASERGGGAVVGRLEL